MIFATIVALNRAIVNVRAMITVPIPDAYTMNCPIAEITPVVTNVLLITVRKMGRVQLSDAMP